MAKIPVYIDKLENTKLNIKELILTKKNKTYS